MSIEIKPTTNEVRNDLMRLLKITPNISLTKNQPLCELLYELKKKYKIKK